MLSALVCVVVIMFTFGAGIIFVPLSIGLSWFAVRRIGGPHGFLVGVGVVLNALLAVSFIGTMVVLIYDLVFPAQ